MDNSINKYNNQYLKCIVTKYKSAIDVLANSGSLIVHKPKDGDDRSYVYLGNTFLASGYGFKEPKSIEIAENIVNHYDNDINTIHNDISTLRSDLTSYYTNLTNTVINEYVKKGTSHSMDNQSNWGGDVSNTYVLLDNKKVPLINIIQHGREADYMDFEIKSISKQVIMSDGKTYELPNNEDIINLPIGSSISKVIVSIKYDPHDSGGIKELLVKYANTENTENNIYIHYDGNIPTSIDESTWEKQFILDFANDGYVIVSNEDIDIISSMSIVVMKTPTYKPYPELKELFDINIKSTGNSILEHYIDDIGLLKVHPLPYIKYYGSTSPILNNNFLNELSSSEKLLNNDDIIMYDYIPISYNVNRIVICVPSSHKLINISYMPNQSSIYFGNEEYNWSGSATIIPYLNIKYQMSNSLCVVCTAYDITISESPALSGGSIKLTLSKIDDSKIMVNNNPSSITNYLSTYNNPNVFRFKNEMFDNLYWINENINQEKRLKEIYRNGLSY